MNNLPPDRPLPLARPVTTYDMILVLRRRRWLYLLLLVVTGFLSYSYLKNRAFPYSSSASFYLNDNPSSSMSNSAETRPIDMSITGENFNRVYQLAHSTKVYDHLINKFSLYKHYNLDPTDEFSYSKIIDRLGSRIVVKKSQFDLVTVSVQDNSRYMAADMANEIVTFLDQLNKDLIIQSLRIKMSIYKNLIDDIRSQSAINTFRLDTLLHQMSGLASRAGKMEMYSDHLLSIQQRLNAMVNDMENSEKDLLKLQRYYSLGMETINLRSLPTLIVMQVALPSPYSNTPPTLSLTLLAVVLAAMLLVIFTYMYMRYEGFIQLVFRGAA